MFGDMVNVTHVHLSINIIRTAAEWDGIKCLVKQKNIINWGKYKVV